MVVALFYFYSLSMAFWSIIPMTAPPDDETTQAVYVLYTYLFSYKLYFIWRYGQSFQ